MALTNRIELEITDTVNLYKSAVEQSKAESKQF